jgi:hypothetical protein
MNQVAIKFNLLRRIATDVGVQLRLRKMILSLDWTEIQQPIGQIHSPVFCF